MKGESRGGRERKRSAERKAAWRDGQRGSAVVGGGREMRSGDKQRHACHEEWRAVFGAWHMAYGMHVQGADGGAGGEGGGSTRTICGNILLQSTSQYAKQQWAPAAGKRGVEYECGLSW